MLQKVLASFAFLAGLSALIMDSFIAHGLEKFLAERYSMIVEQSLATACRYQLIFALFLLVLALMQKQNMNLWLLSTQIFMSFGLIFFSGSIYLKHLAKLSFIGALAPLGGILLMLSFLLMLPALLINK